MPRFPRTTILIAVLAGLSAPPAGVGRVLAQPGAPLPPAQNATTAGKFAPFDLTYLPAAGPQGLVGIRPAEMVKRLPPNEAAAQCQALLSVMMGQFLALCFEGDLSAAQPPAFEDLEQCVFGVSLQATMATGKEQGTLIAGAGSPCLLKTTRPFDWAGAARKWFPKAEKMSHAGRDYLRTPWKADVLKKMFPQRADVGEVYMAVFVPDERTLVIGNESQIRALLKRLKSGKRPPTLPGWKEFERDLIAVVFDTRTTPCVKGDWPADAAGDVGRARTLIEAVKVLAAGITIEERTDVRFTALARDAAAAREAMTAIRRLLESARKDTAAAKDDMPAQARKLIEQALDNVEINRSGRTVRMHAGVNRNVLKMLAEAAAAEDPKVQPVITEPSSPRGSEGWRP